MIVTKDGGYASASGTSFSAPFVSGLFGVLMSNYEWNQAKVISIVLGTAEDIDAVNPEYQGLLGSGRIDADLASSMIHDVYLPLMQR